MSMSYGLVHSVACTTEEKAMSNILCRSRRLPTSATRKDEPGRTNRPIDPNGGVNLQGLDSPQSFIYKLPLGRQLRGVSACWLAYASFSATLDMTCTSFYDPEHPAAAT